MASASSFKELIAMTGPKTSRWIIWDFWPVSAMTVGW
jgi:hypothetical protein